MGTNERKGNEMPELHHIGRVTYVAWRNFIISQHHRDGTSEVADPPEWINVPSYEQDAWQAAGVAARDDGYTR